MRPLPPFPLVDGHLIIDNSALELLKCPRLFENQWLRRRVLATSRAGRNFGSTVHVGMAVRYRECGSAPCSLEATSNAHLAMQQWLQENPQPLEDFRDFNHACLVLSEYNKHYQEEPFTILKNREGLPIVEASFALPFGKVNGYPVIYAGKVDLGIEDNNGVWSFDTKTAFMFGEGWEKSMQMDSGQLGYDWALRQAVPPGMKVNGYVINGVRIRRPKKGDEYKGVAPVDASDFVRLPFFVSDETIDEWWENTMHSIEVIMHWYERGYFPQRRSQCVGKYGVCDMFDVCSVGPSSREGILYESGTYEENTWSPLKQVEE